MSIYDPKYMKVDRMLLEEQVKLLGGRYKHASDLMRITCRQLLSVPRIPIPMARGIRWTLNHYDWDLAPASPDRWCDYAAMKREQINDWYLDARAEELLGMRCYRLIISKWVPDGRLHNGTCRYFQEEGLSLLIRRDQIEGSIDCHACGGANRDST